METLLQFNLLLAVLFSFYYVFLRKETYFGGNRAYLLAIVPGSFLLTRVPSVLPEKTIDFDPNLLGEIVITALSVSRSTDSLEQSWSIPPIQMIYLGGVILLSLLFVYRLYRTQLFLKSNLPQGFVGSFMFKTFGNLENETIQTHEEMHGKMGHSIDVFLAELLKIICWFNPVVFIYQKELKLLHEFQADQKTVSQTGDSMAYAKLLVNEYFHTKEFTLVHTFKSGSNLKQRLKMLQKQTSSRTMLLKYLFILPLVGLLAFTQLACENQRLESTLNKATGIQIDEFHKKSMVHQVVDEPPEFKGGASEMYRFIAYNMKYPKDAQRNDIKGKVIARFVVQEDGTVGKDIEILMGLGYGCDEEVKRVLREMPAWLPGKNKGVPVKTYFTMPVVFMLE